jgi:hypothetical protein
MLLNLEYQELSFEVFEWEIIEFEDFKVTFNPKWIFIRRWLSLVISKHQEKLVKQSGNVESKKIHNTVDHQNSSDRFHTK